MRNKYYTSRDPIKNYFPLPNEVFALGLSPGALAVYSYLMYIEDRTTYQCHASYKTIGKAVNMSPNTVRKYVTELVERGAHSNRAHNDHHAGWTKTKRKPSVHACPFSSPSSSFTSKSLQSWTRSVSRNASESGWKRSNRRSRKTPVHPREPRVAAVSGFSGHSRARAHQKLKTGRCADVRENKNSTEAQRSGFGRKRRCSGMDETCRLRQMREHAETGKIERFWTPRRGKSSRLWICQGIKMQKR